MARAVSDDPLQNFNYYMLDVPVAAIIPLAFPFKTGQGMSEQQLVSFRSISVPSVEMQFKTIREGNWPFAHQIPIGHVTTGDVTIEGAVTPLSLDFFLWFRQAIWGLAAPRRNFTVIHARQDKLIPRRIIVLEGCVPKSWKPSSDFDASSSEVSIETLTMSVNNVEILPGSPV